MKRKFTKMPKKDEAVLAAENPDNPDEVLSNTEADVHNEEDAECDLGTVSQINNVTYAVNGRVRMYPSAPGDNHMTPRADVEGRPHHNDITDILGQAEATLEANAMKGAHVRDSFGSEADGMDLGVVGTSQMAPAVPLAQTTRRSSGVKKAKEKRGFVIDYNLDDNVPDLQVNTVMTFQVNPESEA